MPIRLITYRKGNVLPDLPGRRIEHSNELFHVYEQTAGYQPHLIVAYQDERPVAKLLSVVRKSTRIFPPSIIKRCEIYGYGEYFDENLNKETLFGEMLDYLTQNIIQQSFLIEFRNLEEPLFGYKHFRRNHYFSINWIRVYNSLHNRVPEKQLEPARKRQINRAVRRGATTKILETEEELDSFLKMLKKSYSSKIRKHFPDINFFRQLATQYPEKETSRIFATSLQRQPLDQRHYCRNGSADAGKPGEALFGSILHIFRWRCLFMVFRGNAKDISLVIPRSDGRMGSSYSCIQQRIPTF